MIRSIESRGLVRPRIVIEWVVSTALSHSHLPREPLLGRCQEGERASNASRHRRLSDFTSDGLRRTAPISAVIQSEGAAVSSSPAAPPRGTHSVQGHQCAPGRAAWSLPFLLGPSAHPCSQWQVTQRAATSRAECGPPAETTGTKSDIAATDQIRPIATTPVIIHASICIPSDELAERGAYFLAPECEVVHRSPK
jgi:hypothetical protein